MLQTYKTGIKAEPAMPSLLALQFQRSEKVFLDDQAVHHQVGADHVSGGLQGVQEVLKRANGSGSHMGLV